MHRKNREKLRRVLPSGTQTGVKSISTVLNHCCYSGQTDDKTYAHICGPESKKDDENSSGELEGEASGENETNCKTLRQRNEDYMKSSLLAYVTTLGVNAAEHDVLQEIRSISESFGYFLVVWHSVYRHEKERDDNSDECLANIDEPGNRSLERIVLRCKRYSSKHAPFFFSACIRTRFRTYPLLHHCR